MKQIIMLKRAYDPADTEDGLRVFVDKLWPRGLSHETFHYDIWAKNIAPSTELRKWFHADPDNRWNEFEAKYRGELIANPDFGMLKQRLKNESKVTLLYSSHDPLHNNAIIVKSLLT